MKNCGRQNARCPNFSQSRQIMAATLHCNWCSRFCSNMTAGRIRLGPILPLPGARSLRKFFLSSQHNLGALSFVILQEWEVDTLSPDVFSALHSAVRGPAAARKEFFF
jgi:hypothetical protein